MGQVLLPARVSFMKPARSKTRKTTARIKKATVHPRSLSGAPSEPAPPRSSTFTVPPPSSSLGKTRSLYDYAHAVSDVDAQKALRASSNPPTGTDIVVVGELPPLLPHTTPGAHSTALREHFRITVRAKRGA